MLCAIGLIFAENNNRDNFQGLNKPLFVMDNRFRPHPIVSEYANKSISSLVVTLFKSVNDHFENGQELVSAQQLLKQAKVISVVEKCFICFYD